MLYIGAEGSEQMQKAQNQRHARELMGVVQGLDHVIQEGPKAVIASLKRVKAQRKEGEGKDHGNG